MQPPIKKYPRTHHLAGSRLQAGDEDLSSVPFSELDHRAIVIEEKVDGANAAISFSPEGDLLLQSRGHYLTGGYRERHFSLFKTWAQSHRGALASMLGRRYIMYGEWLYAKHTVSYDQLPHYFLEFDVFDREDGVFLSTKRRNDILDREVVVPVPVLFSGIAPGRDSILDCIGPSRYKSPGWSAALAETCNKLGLDVGRALRETDASDLMEGLYIKVEADGRVVDRLKYVRASFLQAVFEAEGHWLKRPIIPNQLQAAIDIFAPQRSS